MALNKITPTNIDMQALVETLESDYHINSNENGPATVDGTASEFMAVAALNGDELAVDKNTVDKALSLYDSENSTVIPASDVVTMENFEGFATEFAESTQYHYNKGAYSAILSLRSEVYSLISALARKGVLIDHGVNDGYYDAFLDHDIKYNTNLLTTAVGVGSITGGYVSQVIVPAQGYTVLKEGFYYIVEKVFTDETKIYELSYIDSIVSISDSENYRIYVKDFKNNTKLSLLDGNGVYVETPVLNFYEVRGQTFNNSFSFSSLDSYTETGTEYEISFDDDTLTDMITSINNTDGFAVSYRIPANKVGNLKTFTINAKPTAGASTLRCYVLEDSHRGDSDQPVTDLYDDEDSVVIAKSRDVYIAPYIGSGNMFDSVTFNFADVDGKYKTALVNNTYTFVIVPLDLSATGTWAIRFSRNPEAGDDTQTNNFCYTYNKNASNIYVYTQKSFNSDLIFSTIVTNVATYSEHGFKNGLYTSPEFAVDFAVCDYTASIMVNREGLFQCNADVVGGFLNPDTVVSFSNDTNPKLAGIINTRYVGNSYGFKSSDTVAVGDHFMKLTTDSTDNTLEVECDFPEAHFNTGDKVYKIGYKVFATCYNNMRPENAVTTQMELKKIIRKNLDHVPNASDELIYTMPADAQFIPDANSMKVSVVWNSDAPSEYFSDTTFKNNNFIGRIYKLIVSASNIRNYEIETTPEPE